MKTTRLVFQNIGSFFKNKPYFMITIFLAIAVTTFGMLFFFGYSLRFYNESISQQSETRTLEVVFSEDSNKTMEALLTSIRNEKKLPQIKDVFLSDEAPIGGAILMGDPSNMKVIGEYDSTFEGMIQGEYFNSIDQQGNICVANALNLGSESEPYRIGDMIKVKGNSYKIVGFREGSFLADTIAMPMTTYIKNGFPVNYVRFVFDKPFTENQTQVLNNLLPSSSIQTKKLPTQVEWKAIKEVLNELVLYIIVYLFSLVNIFILVHFWMTSNIKTYNIYGICGSTKGKTVAIQALSTFFVTITSFSLGALLYKLILEDKIFVLDASLNLLNYALIFFTLILITSILSIVLGVRFVRKQALYRIEEV